MSGAIIGMQNHVIRVFRDNGATSLETARTLKELGLFNGFIIRAFLKRGILVHAGEDRYYLDERKSIEFFEVRRSRAIVAAVVLIIVFVFFWLVMLRN